MADKKKTPLPQADNPDVRWPNKPKKKDTCDFCDRFQDTDGQWHLPRCGKPAVETCVVGEKNYLTTLCQDHAIELEERGQVRRNPRLKKRKKRG